MGGFDDDTGKEILGYADGFIYYFWVQVLNITKFEENLPTSSLDNIELPVQMESFSPAENFDGKNLDILPEKGGGNGV